MTLPVPDSTSNIATQLLRFAHHDQQRIAACAGISPRIAQLALSFPLLFSVLSYPYGPFQPRADAIVAAVGGASLRDVARIIGLPFCLRRIAPEACPQNLRHHHWSEAAHRKLHPLIPEDDAVVRYWLSTLFVVAQRSDEDVAIWMARQRCMLVLGRVHPDALQPLLMFAWYSLHYPSIVASNAKWSPDINLRSALKRCEHWLKVLSLFTVLDTKGVADPWLPEVRAGRLHILPLTTPHAILDEATAMQNCLVDYGEYVANGTCRMFSVRYDGRRVATLQLTLCEQGQVLIISQIKGLANGPCPTHILVEVTKVVHGYQPRRFSTELCRPAHQRLHLGRCIGPYRNAMPESDRAWLDTLAIDRLFADCHQLSRCARIVRPANW